MNRVKRYLRFWGRNMLENISLILGISLLVFLFAGIGRSDNYPYYLMVFGGFMLLVAIIGYFQTYVPLLVSFNSRRKDIILWIMGSMIVTIAAILLISALICYLFPGKESSSDFGVLFLLTGMMFLESGIGLIVGGIYVKWRKSGMIIFTVLSILGGAGIGFWVSASNNGNFTSSLSSFFHSWTVIAVGFLIFLLCGFLCTVMIRKMEVRN